MTRVALLRHRSVTYRLTVRGGSRRLAEQVMGNGAGLIVLRHADGEVCRAFVKHDGGCVLLVEPVLHHGSDAPKWTA